MAGVWLYELLSDLLKELTVFDEIHGFFDLKNYTLNLKTVSIYQSIVDRCLS